MEAQHVSYPAGEFRKWLVALEPLREAKLEKVPVLLYVRSSALQLYSFSFWKVLPFS